MLAVQGEDDEYGTLEQVRRIVLRLPKTRLLVIPKCGHSPHRDQPELLIREAGRFILEHPSDLNRRSDVASKCSLERRRRCSPRGLDRASAQATGPIKVGLMLPYSGTYASLGNMIENGFKLYVEEQGGKLGGREIQYFKVDDESEPSKATDNVNKLIKRDQVDVLVGTVHSGVALAMAKAAKDSKTLLIIPNAGADADHRRDVRAEHRAQLVLELAAGLCDGHRRRARKASSAR